MKTSIHTNPRRLIDVAIRIILASVFVYAGSMKIGDPLALADSIASFKILPGIVVNPLALGLPPFEIGAGLLLLIGWSRRMAALAIVAATAVFATALLSALLRGITVDCGCFGAGRTPSILRMWLDLGRDVPLMVGGWIAHRLAIEDFTSGGSLSSEDQRSS